MNVISIVPPNALVDRFIRAAAECGFPPQTDFNGPEQDGFGPRQATIRNGRRESMATAFLAPASHRANLAVFTASLAHRICISGGRATGVQIERAGRTLRLHARSEVILCGGSIGSAHLLGLSGIGDSERLRACGIVVRHHLPSVGQNLQDHLAVTLMMRSRSTQSYGLSLRTLPRAAWTLADYLLRKRGALASNIFEAHGFIRSVPGLDRPDVQIIFIPAHRNHSGFPIPLGHGFGINVALLHPRSRGFITVASADPRIPPKIDPNFLSAAEDIEPLIRGFSVARSILQASAFANCNAREVLPGPGVWTQDEVARYIRNSAFTVFHPTGTCRMGGDANSVVDPELRVRGIANLRIADASIFPTVVSGNTNAAVVMVAEKAADLILGKPAAPAIDPTAQLRTERLRSRLSPA